METTNKDVHDQVMWGTILNKTPKSELSFKDNIFNPNNIEYLEEVKFNKVTNDLQMDFCYRYWDTLDDESKEWFKQQLK